MKQIKVLMVAGTMHVGGQENQLMHLVRHADKEQFQIDFTSTMQDAYYRSEIEQLGGKFIVIPKMSWKCPWKYCKELYNVMKKGNYDVVHSHELFHTGITLLIAFLAGVPCRFAHSHSSSDNYGTKRGWVRTVYNALMRRMIDMFSTRQIACSSIAGKFLFGEKKVEKKGYSLVFNSVDTELFIKDYNTKSDILLPVQEGWKSVLHAGHVVPIKNQMFLVEIASVFKSRGTKIHIFCAGSGDCNYETMVQREIEEKKLENYITLLGMRSDIASLMRKVNAFVLPSKFEGMPLVMIEAQASGLPCVVANTFSKEVDFGIDMVEWLQLSQGAECWADALERAVCKERAEKEFVEQAISKHGFDSRVFSKKICELYRVDYESKGR